MMKHVHLPVLYNTKLFHDFANATNISNLFQHYMHTCQISSHMCYNPQITYRTQFFAPNSNI